MEQENKTQKDEIIEEQSEGNEMIEKAIKAAERLEEAYKKAEELVKRNEAIAVDAHLGGTALAGKNKEDEVETAKEYAKRVLNGN